ncbi:MAG: hypothetical protein R2771_10770 [Saprospiraceae bacterium]
MLNNKENEVKVNFEKKIKKNPEKYPFLSREWEISKKKNIEYVKFYRSSILISLTRPFYKPFSKIIDINRIDE